MLVAVSKKISCTPEFAWDRAATCSHMFTPHAYKCMHRVINRALMLSNNQLNVYSLV